ncbi:MAG: ABC transporter substrate-binding protein [Chloroflexi bacterium]|nr:ABC transporter substrate-binding protein [Chloroflexota bacterium]
MRQTATQTAILSLVLLAALVASACVPGVQRTSGDKPAELKVALVDFMSGNAAKFGINALNAGKLLLDQLNEQGGIGGVRVNYQLVDEAGTVDQVVTNYRRLVLDEGMDIVIGYTSSANCLAIAPVAEELKRLTIIHICGTYRLYEDMEPKYVVRTSSQAISDNAAAALYVLAVKPDVHTIAGINDDYAFGRDSWEMFKRAIQRLKPDVQFVEELWPKAFIGEYSAEISKLLAARPDVIHTSLWGGHMDAFIRQAQARNLFNQSLVVMTTGETALLTLGKDVPPGIAMSGRGQYFKVPDTEMNRKFFADYSARYNEIPVYPAYRMAQSIYGLKAAYERAIQANGGRWPTQEQVIEAFRDLTFETPSGTIRVQRNLDGVQQAMYGITSTQLDPQWGFPLLERVQIFPPEQVNPPPGTKTLQWLDTAFGRR